MAVDVLTNLDLPRFGEVCDPDRPILSYAWSAPGAHRAAAHAHPRGHIITPVSGAYWVKVDAGAWLVPSGQAIWIPPLAPHEVYSRGAVSARILFVDPSRAAGLPACTGTARVSALLSELTTRAVEYGNDYEPGGSAARLAEVLLDELASLETAPLLVPISQEPRLARLMALLVEDPACTLSLTELASGAGASPRTLARLFEAEAGMTYTQWRTRLRLVASIERLTQGASVTDVAADLGYASASAFVYMFRTNLGVSPGRYAAQEVHESAVQLEPNAG